MITKQAIDVSFAQGLDTKTDPKRVAVGNFVSLQNSVFNKGGLLQKRNGNAQLTSLPDTNYSYLTTLNDNLMAIGTNISAFDGPNDKWGTPSNIQPLSLKTLPLIRNNLNQTAADACVAPNGLVCTAYLEYNGDTTVNKYVIADSTTGQNITAPILIPVSSGTVSGGMKVFLLGRYFVIVFTNTISATAHLQYIAISIYNPSSVTTNTDLAASYVPASTLSWDGYVVANKLYVGFDTTSGGQSVKVLSLNATLGLSPAVTFAGKTATMMSITADITNSTNPSIYISFYDSASSTGYTAITDQVLNVVVAPVEIISSGSIANMISAAQNGSCQLFLDIPNAYTWDSGFATNYIDTLTVSSAGVVSAVTITVRSVGLASKAFIVDGVIYFLASYQSNYQPTYFLINGTTSTEAAPVIAAKLAYQNGRGYLTTGLPSVSVNNGNVAQIAYLYKDVIQAVNKGTAVAAGTQVAGIYSQLGINLVTFEIGTQNLTSAEIANDLHLGGGFLWLYDGYLPVEHNFFLWPDTDQATPANTAVWSDSGGFIAAKPDGSTNTKAYYVQFTYEWTDNQGNAYRSAPSIPIPITTTGSGTTGSITYSIPTLRLTMKSANQIKVVAYRWSVAQQIYYQTTSILNPLLSDITEDTATFVDTSSDATILGNNILYTNGGVVEDVNAPATNLLALFDTRLWTVDAEDQNLLWFSKQVIEATPVEMSDLFTMYIPPTTGTEGSTGPITSIFPMDDKLIIGKKNAFLYVNGTGPDNTGANNNYSQPIFITSSVGCSNQGSIVLIPTGLMFQSNKGIWILDRGLNTTYIGAPVEDFTIGAMVLSAQLIPGTNQVRFVLDSGVWLMYDYFYGEWSTFTGIPAVSSCIYNGLSTFIDSYGRVFQESPGYYLDGSNPVLMSFTTGPLRLGDLQNYQRAFFFYLLGQFYTPHTLAVSIAYDYSISPEQTIMLYPKNYSTAYGSGRSQSPYGQGTLYGGSASLEQFRVFLQKQRCQAFSITVKEIYDGTYSVPPGQGLSLSGINVVLGFKNKFPTLPSNISFG